MVDQELHDDGVDHQADSFVMKTFSHLLGGYTIQLFHHIGGVLDEQFPHEFIELYRESLTLYHRFTSTTKKNQPQPIALCYTKKMQKDVCYGMQSDAPDPRNGGSTKSWWFFYKWRAGDTWVPAKEGCADAVVGDRIWFAMDEMLLAKALVQQVHYNLQGEKELHFNSDHLLVPTTCYSFKSNYTGRSINELEFVDLSTIPEGEEPEWLKSLLIKERP